MKRFLTIIWQSCVIVVFGILLGLTINAASENPLPFKRVPKYADDRWPIVTAEEVKTLSETGEAIVIDGREPKEYKAGHIPMAINLPATEFSHYFEEIGDALPREGVQLIVYCQGGMCDESHEVLDLLENLGFKDLYLFPGGWLDWKGKGYPTETSEETP